MIVQPPEAPGGQAFVILQNGHTAFSGQLARRFGNELFQPLEPTDLVVDLVEWHDEGWTELDSRFLTDPKTGLPYSLTHTPLAEALRTSELSPTLGEARHPFIGLLSSMHSCGLLNGRYGLLEDDSLKVTLPEEIQVQVDAVIVSETKRQDRLRAQLLADPETAHLADEALVWRIYKALEFFDILSLYVQCEHHTRQQETRIPHVPVDLDPSHDVTVTVTPLGDRAYRLSPYPFDVDPFEPFTPGKYLSPQPEGTDFAALWEATEPAEQRVHLVS